MNKIWTKIKYKTLYISLWNLQIRIYLKPLSEVFGKKYYAFRHSKVNAGKGFNVMAYPIEICYSFTGHKNPFDDMACSNSSS